MMHGEAALFSVVALRPVHPARQPAQPLQRGDVDYACCGRAATRATRATRAAAALIFLILLLFAHVESLIIIVIHILRHAHPKALRLRLAPSHALPEHPAGYVAERIVHPT